MIRLPVCLVVLAVALAVPAPAAARSDDRAEGLQELPPAPTVSVRASAAVEPSEPISEPVAAAPALAATASAVASWFGPGLYGNRTACGLTLTSALPGVAHRTLPCGSLVTLRYESSLVTVPVIDRGPFNASREFDLTFATKTALGCPDLCRLAWLR